MTTVALILSSLALAISLGTLLWNIVAFGLTGPRVRAELLLGARGPGGVISASPSGAAHFKEHMPYLISQGYSEPVIGVKVTNRGRTPTTVDGWTVTILPSGFGCSNLGDQRNPSLPHRLEAHASATWWAPLDIVQAVAKTSSPGASRISCHAEATVPGKTIKSDPIDVTV